jgi:hypothetical protein
MIKKCKLLKGSEQEIIICMLYGTAEGEANYVKLLSLSIVNINSKQKSGTIFNLFKHRIIIIDIYPELLKGSISVT